VTFTQILLSSINGMFPSLLYWLVLPLIPFIVAEQLWPVADAPRWRDYGMNLLISLSTVYLSLPLGIVAGLLSAHARHLLPWKSFSFTFHNIGAIPIAGPALEILAMIFVPLFLHDFWFYWSHRIEHKVPVLQEVRYPARSSLVVIPLLFERLPIRPLLPPRFVAPYMFGAWSTLAAATAQNHLLRERAQGNA
jgi:hypothetical protein